MTNRILRRFVAAADRFKQYTHGHAHALGACLYSRLSLTLLSRIRTGVFAAYLALLVLVQPTLAQFDEIGDALCESGVGELIAYGFALFAVVLIIKFGFMVMAALDKYDSPKPQEHEEGVDLLKSSAFTLLAAFAPLLIGVVFELIGISTFTCWEWDIGILS